jgi:hypothetical protein
MIQMQSRLCVHVRGVGVVRVVGGNQKVKFKNYVVAEFSGVARASLFWRARNTIGWRVQKKAHWLVDKLAPGTPPSAVPHAAPSCIPEAPLPLPPSYRRPYLSSSHLIVPSLQSLVAAVRSSHITVD